MSNPINSIKCCYNFYHNFIILPISVMSDIELPDFSVQSDLSIDIEKGIFLRKKNSNLTDNESNDSGNNSMNTNGSGKCLD